MQVKNHSQRLGQQLGVRMENIKQDIQQHEETRQHHELERKVAGVVSGANLAYAAGAVAVMVMPLGRIIAQGWLDAYINIVLCKCWIVTLQQTPAICFC